jgi:penicillin-binding protein 2
LQVVQHRHYQTLAETNRIAIVPIVPNRGVIRDRNGIVLAQSYSAYTLEIQPARVKDLEQTIDALAEVIDIQPRDRRRFKKLMDESKSFESLPIRTRLTDNEVARFAVNRYRFPGVEIKARLFRQYPYAELASHVVGYIGRINDRDVARIEEWGESANYKGSDYIGKVGIELSYERELHGTTGVEEVEVDAGGRAVRTLSRVAPASGNDLTLTLDIKLQEVAEAAFGTRRGALVALDPATGEVLAMVSKPGYDPNLFVDGIDTANWELLNESPDKPLLNRPLRGAYPPGSTIKPFLALSALTSGKRTPAQTIFDPGYFQLPGAAHRFNDDKKGGHGTVDMYKSIVASCDTYYYILASETDIDDTYRFMSQLGFGRKTGIDVEGELPGILPSREWKRQRFSGKEFREEHRKWYLGDSISAGIGQGYNAFTPIQLAQAIAMIANDGVSFPPHLVQSIRTIGSDVQRPVAAQPPQTLGGEARASRGDQECARRRGEGRHERRGVPQVGVCERGARRAPRSFIRSRARSTRRARSTSACAITHGISPTRRRTIRASPSPCWSRMAGSAPRRRRRSRGRCSITSLPARRSLVRRPPSRCRKPKIRATDGSIPGASVGGAVAACRQLPLRRRADDCRRRAHHAVFRRRPEPRPRMEPGDEPRFRAGADVGRREHPAADDRAWGAAAVCGGYRAAHRCRPMGRERQRLAALAQPGLRTVSAVRAHESRSAAHARLVFPEVRGQDRLGRTSCSRRC